MRAPRDIVFVKLGGSLITDKRRPRAARPRVIRRLAGELARAAAARPRSLVVGHGSGSFGHVEALRQGLGGESGARPPLRGIGAVQREAAALHRLVAEALAAAGAAPFSLAPSSFMSAAGGRPCGLRLEPLTRALELGLLPLTHGDVVLDRRLGAAICSTERVFLALIRALRRRGRRVSRVLWLGETDGVYDAAGRLVSRLDPASPTAAEVGRAAGPDVTGGMRHRVEVARALARIGVASWIGNGLVRGRLTRALAGEPAGGTLVPAAPAAGRRGRGAG